MPVLVILRLPTTRWKRIMAIVFFTARLIISPVSIVRMIYWVDESTTQDLTYNLFPYMIASLLVATLEILSACILYGRPLFEVLETGFSMSQHSQSSRPSSTEYGLYSRGTWPYTQIKSLEDLLTGNQTEYKANVEASGLYGKKSETGSDSEHIHVSCQVDVSSATPVGARRDWVNRIKIPSMSSDSKPYSGFEDVPPPLLLEKSLPPTPQIQKGTYLLPWLRYSRWPKVSDLFCPGARRIASGSFWQSTVVRLVSGKPTPESLDCGNFSVYDGEAEYRDGITWESISFPIAN